MTRGLAKGIVSGLLLMGAGVLLAILVMRSCQSPSPTVTVNTDSARLATQISARKADSVLRVTAYSMEQLKKKEREDSIALHNITLKLNEQFRLASVYRQQLDYYASVPLDTGMIPVHPNYVLYCDSAADALLRVADNFNAFKQEYATLKADLKDQLSLKDREITVYQKGKQELESQNAWLSKGVNEIAIKNKPRNAMYFGLVANGDQVTPIRAGGAGLTFVNKKGWLAGADAMIHEGGGLLYQARIGWKIKFR